ncbi:MAG: T9SS type A sorting domain-containing protein [Chitinophagales bacterium]|nr:T9SS type A sorting domain-containing protein [Chitinophagales bacterium]
MRHPINVLMTLLALLSLLIYQPANAQQTLACEGVYEEIITSPNDLFIHGADFFIPDTDVLSIDITGGDGGDVIFGGLTCNTHIHGGTGARVQVSFEVGNGDDQLEPGGIIRTYRGERGGTRVPGCLNTGDELSGGGGGATAIVYLPPSGDADHFDWRLLAIAGGGGGAVRPGPNKLDRIGGGGMAGKNGGNSGSTLGGGVDGNCADADHCLDATNHQGVGSGMGCTETHSYDGEDVVIASTPLAQSPIRVRLKPLNEYILTAGLGQGNLQVRGGFGFCGGGGSGNGGGGGGGFHGGAVSCEEGGGGGGSYASDKYGAFDKTITPGVAGGTTDVPKNGKIKITTYKVPEAVCPPVTITLDENGNGEFIKADYLLNSSVYCGGTATISVFDNNSAEVSGDVISLDCNDIGKTYTINVAVFEAQNSIGLTCSTTLTLMDNTPPDVQCQNITISLDEYGDVSITPADINNESTDACGIANMSLSEMDFDCDDVGDNNVTLTVEDVNGNTSTCTAIITIEDNTLPYAHCIGGFLGLNLGPDGTLSLSPSSLSGGLTDDACGVASLTLSQSDFTCADVGQHVVTLFVEDVNGNIAQCNNTVAIYDPANPDAQCQNITISLDAAGHASITTADINNESSDECGIASMSLSTMDFGCMEVGDNDVTLTVEDVNGKESDCIATVTVEDNTSPNALCKDNWIYLDYDGTISITPGHMNNGSNDACGIASLSLSQNIFTCDDVGDNTVTLTVEDVNGNTSQCTSTLSVYDVDSPFWLCKNTTVELDATGHTSITTEDIDNGSTDACGIASMTLNKTDFNCSDIGENPVTMTLVDTHGNTSSCHVIVTVIEGKNLPSPWQSTDVGTVTVGNLFEYFPCTAPGEFSITGSGNNAISTTTDNVAFAHQTLCGDGTITAKIESIEPNGYGGLMIRETADDGAKQVAIFSNLSNTLRHEVRYNTNTPKQIGSFFKPNPIWLRIERQGDWVFSYSSFDGINFQYVHGVFISMQNCVEVGLASFTYLPNAQTEAVFSNVLISGSNGSFSEEGSTVGTKPSKPSSTTLNPPSDITKNKVAPNSLPNKADKHSLNNTAQPDPATGTPLNHYAPTPINLYPNPNQGQFSLQFKKPTEEQATLYVYNSYGQQMHSQVLEPGMTNTQLSLERLQSGTYWLKISGGKHVLATKVFTVTK